MVLVAVLPKRDAYHLKPTDDDLLEPIEIYSFDFGIVLNRISPNEHSVKISAYVMYQRLGAVRSAIDD